VNYIVTVPTSCATGTDADCQDTATSPDLAWLAIPGLVLVIVVIAAIVYFTVRGTRGR
jgi:hypothetical protein